MRISLGLIPLALVTLFVAVDGYAQDVPRRSAVELWRLGGTDAVGPEAFSHEPFLVADGSGNLFARVSTPPGVSVFDSEGNFVRSIGRSGQGPGEFQAASGHGLLGDTLWVINWPTPRVSRFLTNGTHLSTSHMELMDFGVALSSPQSVTALLRGGRVLAVPSGTPVGGTGRVQLPVLFGGSGPPEREVAKVSLPRGLMIAGLGSFALAPVMVPPLLVPCLHGDGYLTVDWDDDGSGELRLARYGYDGGNRWRRTVTVATNPIPRSTRAEWIARGVEMARPHVEPAMRDGRIQAGPVASLVENGLDLPTYFPPIDDVVLGGDGSVWLGLAATEDQRQWLVLDAGGIPQFSVQLPSSVDVQAAHGMSVWATHAGEFDVPLVSRFEIR